MARKPQAKRVSKPRKSARRTAGGSASKRATRPSISKKIEAHNKAVDTVGRENVKPGPILIGELQGIAPDKKGVKELREVLKTIDKAGKLRTFSYAVKVKDKTGKVIKDRPRGHILKLSDRQEMFAQRRSKHPRRKKKPTGKQKPLSQSKRAKRARKVRLTRERINEAVRGFMFKNLPVTDEIRELYKAANFFITKLGDKAEAEAAIKQIRELRGFTFDIEIYREV